jgi:hypothetical protein
MFEIVVKQMSEDEFQQVPDVLIYLAQANYMLGDFEQALLFTKQLLTSHNLSDQQKLIRLHI